MRIRGGLCWASCLVLALAIAGCGHDGARASASAPPPADGSGDEQTKTIVLPHDEPDLPPLPGREAVVSSCSICHTTRYLTMQPPLSRAVWTAEVRKMMTAFGAPVAEPQVPQIVDYLASIQEASAAPSRP
jgi:cytochrome c5